MLNGKCNIVTLRSKAREVLHEFYSQRDSDVEKDKIRTAAKLIKDDIKLVSLQLPWNWDLKSPLISYLRH